jgi:hypothetical protein
MRMANAVAVSESPFSFAQQTYDFGGERWEIDVTMPAMRRKVAESFIAQMAKLNGRSGTFLIGDYDGQKPMGSAAAGVTAVGGTQRTNTLQIAGLGLNMVGALMPGDYLQLGAGATARLYKNLDQVNSDGSGSATINVWPKLRSTPNAGDPIITTGAKGVFRLAAPFGWSANEASTYSLTWTAIEAL